MATQLLTKEETLTAAAVLSMRGIEASHFADLIQGVALAITRATRSSCQMEQQSPTFAGGNATMNPCFLPWEHSEFIRSLRGKPLDDIKTKLKGYLTRNLELLDLLKELGPDQVRPLIAMCLNDTHQRQSA